MVKFIKKGMPFILVCLCMTIVLTTQLASHGTNVVFDEVHSVYESEVTCIDALWIEGRDGSVYLDIEDPNVLSPLGLHWRSDDGFTPTQVKQLRQIIREELDRVSTERIDSSHCVTSCSTHWRRCRGY